MPTARDLLARVIAWPGPSGSGYVNAHVWSPHKDHPLPDDPRHKVWWGKPVKTLDDFLGWASWAARQANIRDIYFCTSVQSAYDKTKAGKPKPLRNRANAVNLKCLFLDVDYGKPDKDGKKVSYTTLQEALGELAAFCINKSLPGPTAIISTGGGIHCYWILDRAITPAEWQPYADGLKSAALEYGLLCDAGVTIDCARILRVPDTKNWKSDPPRDVTVLQLRPTDYAIDDLKHLLDFAPVTAAVIPVQQATWSDGTPIVARPHLPGEVESLAEGLGYEEKLLDPRPIFTQCAFLGEALQTGGRDYANPLWNLTTLAATFMEHGNKLAHGMADGHRDYNHASTESLWERKLRERSDRNLGWPTCSTIETNGCRSCAGCPLKGKIKSPLSLGRSAPQAPADNLPLAGGALTSDEGYNLAPIDLPEGYVYIGDVICKKTKRSDDDGRQEEYNAPVFKSKLTGAFCTRDPDTLNFVTTVDKGRYHKASLKRDELASRDKIKAALLREHVMYDPDGQRFLEHFLMSLMSKLEQAEQSLIARPFGWHYENGERAGFVYGGKLFYLDGRVIEAGYAAADLKAYYTPSGKIDPWFEACKLITDQHAPVLECIVAVSFASPLMVYPGEYSTLVCAWGEKGRGKSTALEVGMAVWGQPTKAKEQTKSTQNYIMEKMGKTQNLPLYWDEIRDEASQKSAFDVFWQGTEGSTKGRLTSAITARDKDSWHNMIAVCSNNSLVDFLEKHQPNNDAGIMRVLELYVSTHDKDRWHVAAGSPGRIEYHQARAIQSKLEQNYGQMGLRYAQWLAQNDAAVQRDWLALTRSIDAQLSVLSGNADPSVERYWRAAITTILTGAACANQLGCEFHLDEMREYLVEQYIQNTQRVKEVNVNLGSIDNTQQKLTQYLKYQRQNTIWTETKLNPNKPRAKVKVIRGLPLDRETGTEVQWCVVERLLRVGQAAFKDWLSNQQHVATFPVIKSLRESFGATVAKGTLGGGTKYSEGQEYIIEIPVDTGSELEEMMLQGDAPVAANTNDAAA